MRPDTREEISYNRNGVRARNIHSFEGPSPFEKSLDIPTGLGGGGGWNRLNNIVALYVLPYRRMRQKIV